MKHASLFSGIGGFDLAAEWMGWENMFHCEWNEFGQKILKYYWANAVSYGDIKKTDFTIWRGKIDILSGGFPCQPYSTAGKRLGKEDERHLWPEMLRAIREIQPSWVVGENVLGLVNWNGGLVFDEVQSDLEAQGYEVQPFILPACAVNAPHRRDRVWFIAFKNSNRDGRLCGEFEQKGTENGKFGDISTRDSDGIHQQESTWISSNANSDGQHRCDSKYEINTSQRGKYALNDFKPLGGNVANSLRKGPQGRQDIDEWQEHCIERSGAGFGTGSENNERNTPSDFINFPTQSPICGGDDGISRKLHGITFSKWRAESIKAYGNAIVPQVAFQIFKVIQAYEEINN